MAQNQEQQGQLSYATEKQDNLQARQATSGTLVPLQLDSTLTEQCNICSQNLRLCVKTAQDIAANQAVSVKTKLRLVERRLDEHRLRLDIWRSDCQVGQGGLSAITVDKEPNLLYLLSQSFSQLHEQLAIILEGIHQTGNPSIPTNGSANDRM